MKHIIAVEFVLLFFVTKQPIDRADDFIIGASHQLDVRTRTL